MTEAEVEVISDLVGKNAQAKLGRQGQSLPGACWSGAQPSPQLYPRKTWCRLPTSSPVGGYSVLL